MSLFQICTAFSILGVAINLEVQGTVVLPETHKGFWVSAKTNTVYSIQDGGSLSVESVVPVVFKVLTRSKEEISGINLKKIEHFCNLF